MNERAHSPDAGVFARLASWGRYQIGDTYSAANEGLKGRTVGEIAERANRGTFDTLLDIVINDDLRTILWPLPSDNDLKSWQMRAEAWDHPLVLIGGSRRRRAPRPHVRRALHDIVPRPTRCAAASSCRSNGACNS